MKKSILMLVLMLTAIAAGAQDFTVNGLTYKVTNMDSVTVVSYNTLYGKDVRIPSTVIYGQTTYKVTAIGDNVFNAKPIKSISIPASVEILGEQAFTYNDSLQSIRIEDGDTPLTLVDAWYSTFNCGGARYTVYVGRDLISVCRPDESPFPQATSITWGPKVTEIGSKDACCPYLRNAVISNSVKTIGHSAFLWAGNDSDSDALTITMGANVDSIAASAFQNCNKLTSIELPKGLKAIPDACFYGTPIRDVFIPASVMSVGDQAFSWDNNLKTVTIEDSDKPITLIDPYYTTFNNGEAKYTVYVGRNIERQFRPSETPFPQATTITWGPKVTAIGTGEGRSPFLTSAVINNSVKTIGAEAFMDAGNSSNSIDLTITMSAYVDSIGYSAFQNCTKLTSIELPKVLKAIPDACFSGTRIRDVVIPASVMSVGNQAFSWNDSIKTVTIEDNDKPITFSDPYYTTFDNGGARYTVYVGRNIERLFRPSESPFPQATSITWGSMVTAIGSGEGRSPFLKNAVIGNSVKTVGAEAFYLAGYSSEAEELLINMGANVDSIGYSAFLNCSKLKSIVLPKVLKAIPDNCFNGTRIKDVVIPASVMSVGDQAFNWNDSIKTIRIEDSDKPITFNDPYYTTFDNGGASYTVYQGRDIERMFRPSESPFPQAESVAFGAQVTSLGSGMYNCVNISNIIAPWEAPISINSDVFNYDLYQNATLYVPRKHLDSYKAALVWKDFLKKEEMEETKCSTPTATLENGRLHFECETKDVTFHYKYTYPEGREGTGNDVAVGQTIYLTLYATKAGLEDSDKAYYELEISGGGGIIGIKGDVNEDGIVNGTDIQEIINIIVEGE